jgi:hypothetical protein
MRHAKLAPLILLALCASFSGGCSSILGIDQLPWLGPDSGADGVGSDAEAVAPDGSIGVDGAAVPETGAVDADGTDAPSWRAADAQSASDSGVVDSSVGAPDAVGDAAPGLDATTCTPVTFPLPLPAACNGIYYTSPTSITAPGSMWDLSPSTSSQCAVFRFTGDVSGATACEQCTETFNCACVWPIFMQSGPGASAFSCMNSSTGPYLITTEQF